MKLWSSIETAPLQLNVEHSLALQTQCFLDAIFHITASKYWLMWEVGVVVAWRALLPMKAIILLPPLSRIFPE